MNETFLREVDENLRRDQMQDFFKRYGALLIIAVILFLVASGGFIWWKQHEVKRSGAEVEKLAAIYKDVGSGKMDQAPRLQPLAKPGEPWFGSAGEMTALALVKQGKRQEAGQLYAAIAKDQGVPQTIRARAIQVAGSLGVDASSALATKAQ
jgi:hypothetical protein